MAGAERHSDAREDQDPGTRDFRCRSLVVLAGPQKGASENELEPELNVSSWEDLGGPPEGAILQASIGVL